MILLREPTLQDEAVFLSAMQKSISLHHLWVKTPLTHEEFQAYIKRSEQENQKSFLVLKNNEIACVFNISEIVRGCFQNAFLGFYAVAGFENQGIMSAGLKLVLKCFFEELKHPLKNQKHCQSYIKKLQQKKIVISLMLLQ